MGSQEVPRKRKRVTLNVEQLLNQVFLDPKDCNSATFSESDFNDKDKVAGKIECVRLQNFMCHNNLEFNFGDKINFISGKNGSGKSAILTALVVGLGGRTADTNRGHAAKNLIQNGKHRAVIEITMNNSGPRKFKPHQYGKTIKIVRVISGSSSQYKIMSEKGEVISTKRDEIDIINMYFNIQVNNPVTILNQDTARTFIQTSAPKELYNIFMKGTHLEEIEMRVASLKHQKVPALLKLINEKKKVLEVSFQDINQYREKLKKIKERNKFVAQFSDYQNELLWAYVYNIETKINSQKTIENEIEKQIPLIRDKVNKRGVFAKEIDERHKACEANLKELRDNVRENDKDLVEIERSMRISKEQISLKMSEIKKVQKKIVVEQNSCKEIQSEIDNHESRSAEIEAKKSNMEIQKQELEKRLGELIAVMATTQVHQQQLVDTKDAAATVYSHKDQFIHTLKQKLAYKEENLGSLRTEKNQLMVYSKWMPEIVDNIEKAFKNGQFKEKPRGPLGSFIRLKEKKWGPAIENYIGAKTLSSFCVDNNQDYKTLKSITDRINMPPSMKPSIVISKFIYKIHDVRKNETGNNKYNNLLRSITISDPVVSNALIDAIEPESVLLIPTSEEAYGMLEEVQFVPKYCKRAFTLNGDLFHPAPNYRSYAGNVTETRLLQVSQAQAIKFVEQEIHNTKEELSKLQRELEIARLDVLSANEKLNEVNKGVLTLNRQIAACENKLDEIKVDEVPEIFNVKLLKEDLEYRQKSFETCQDTLRMLESSKDDLYTKYKEFKQKFETKQKIKNENTEQLNKTEAEIGELNNEHHKINERSDHYVSLLKSEESKLAKVKDSLAKLQKEFEDAEKQATEAHPERIPQNQDIEALEKELAKVNSMTKALEKIIGDINVVPDDYRLRSLEFIEKHGILENLTRTAKLLEEVVNKLEDTSKRVKEVVTLSTKHRFLSMIEKKKFTGDLIIDHIKKSLTIIIKVESTARDKSSTSTLSGGERSYSMVSFIMALWSNMHSPFFFLDEFDVFMDELNRNMIMSMLLAYAKEKPDQQFVFLTPHANLNNDLLRDVKFFRMNDPRGE